MRHFFLLITFLLLSTISLSQKLSIDTLTFYNDDGNKYERSYCYLIENNIILDSIRLTLFGDKFITNNLVYDIYTNYGNIWYQSLFITESYKTTELIKYKIESNRIVKDSVLRVYFYTPIFTYKIFHFINKNKCQDFYMCSIPRFVYKDEKLIFKIGANKNKYVIKVTGIVSLKQLKKDLNHFIKEINKTYGIKSLYKIKIKIIPA